MGVFHKLSMTIALISLMALLVPFPVARADEVVTFPDPHLQARVREAIEKPVGDIYRSDLIGLTNLSANSEGITDLSGLEYCTSLTYLSLAYNEIGDISQLSSLASLNYLNLHVNRISDISPLSKLTNLSQLSLAEQISPAGNRISDISYLSNLTKLAQLSLSENQISDISPLVENSGLGKGATVDLAENPLDTQSVDVYIPQLEQRGVYLGWGTSHPTTYAQTYTPNHTAARGHSTTHSNSYTQARSTAQHVGDHWPNPGSSGSRWRGILHLEKAKVRDLRHSRSLLRSTLY